MTHWRNKEQQVIFDWIHDPLSDDGRLFRLRCIGLAFGLTERYLKQVYMPPLEWEYPQGMGSELVKEILWWVSLHPNLQQNDPQFYMTDWADLDVDSD